MSAPHVRVITAAERDRLQSLADRTRQLDAVSHKSLIEACAILGVNVHKHSGDLEAADLVYDAIIGLDTPLDQLLARLNITIRPSDT